MRRAVEQDRANADRSIHLHAYQLSLQQSNKAGRSLRLHPQPAHEALVTMRAEIETEAGRAAYAARAGVEGTLS